MFGNDFRTNGGGCWAIMTNIVQLHLDDFDTFDIWLSKEGATRRIAHGTLDSLQD